jgi:3-phenylpropionate/trans-cinnamate dioxygenase ferredoxin subunit
MNDWVDVAPAGDFPPNSCRTLLLHNTAVAVFNVDGDYYAIEDCCSHEAEPLSNGTVEGLEITCPLHLARFSLRTGAALAPPAVEAIATFPVRVADGMVQIRDGRGEG